MSGYSAFESDDVFVDLGDPTISTEELDDEPMNLINYENDDQQDESKDPDFHPFLLFWGFL